MTAPGRGPIAFALAVGVCIDAFLVRMTLVPAVLALVGRAGWWLPKWLDRLLPDLDIEGERLTADRQKDGTDGHGPTPPVAVGASSCISPRRMS